MKKILTIISICIFCIALYGCERPTIEDAKEIANLERGQIAKNITKLNEQREERTYSDKEIDLEQNRLDAEDNKKINISELGQMVDVSGMNCQVSDVILCTNVYDMYSIASQDSGDLIIKGLFKDFDLNSRLSQINGKVYLQDNGDVGNGSIKQFMFMKIVIKNNTKIQKKICFNPYFFKEYKEQYKYITGVEVCEIDKKQQEGPDFLMYSFEPGQEEEFILAFSVGYGANLTDGNIYMDTRFLRNDVSSQPNDIPVGTYFISLPINSKTE